MSVKKTAIGEAQTYGVLPSSWCWARLSDVTSKIVDGTHHTPEYLSEGVPFISVKDIRDGQVHFDDCKFISNAEHSALIKRCHPERGDLLVTKSGTIGRVAIVNTDTPFSLFVSVALLKKTSSNVDSRWTALAFQNWMRTVNVANDVKGSTIKNLHLEDFKSLSIPLAPPNEQRRIVAKIEELFSDLEAGVAALTRARANLKRYRASVLKAAVEGTLTAEWRTQVCSPAFRRNAANSTAESDSEDRLKAELRTVEPASKLLERILTERRRQWAADQLAKFAAAGKQPTNNWQAKYVEPAPPDTTNLPTLPHGWCWTTAEQLCSQITDGEHNQPRYQDDGMPMLTATHVRDGTVTFANAKLIAQDDYERARKRCGPVPGDILVVCVGATTGRAGIVGDDHRFALVRSVLLLRPVINGTFLLTWIQSPSCQRWISGASGASAQAHFYISDAKRMAVPLPPLAEQAEIVATVSEKLSQIESAEVAIDHSLRRAARLRQSILKQAFEGKLVPQDPTDEPASTLLERIQTRNAINNVHDASDNAVKTREKKTKTRPKKETRVTQ